MEIVIRLVSAILIGVVAGLVVHYREKKRTEPKHIWKCSYCGKPNYEHKDYLMWDNVRQTYAHYCDTECALQKTLLELGKSHELLEEMRKNHDEKEIEKIFGK